VKKIKELKNNYETNKKATKREKKRSKRPKELLKKMYNYVKEGPHAFTRVYLILFK